MRSSSTPRPDDVRPAAVAGSFYPAGAAELGALVGALLAEADRRASPKTGPSPRVGRLVGLLVPHAGLAYSGAVAAAAWRELGPARTGDVVGPATVVILGTNHGARWLDGVGVWEAGTWSTPLGPATVDADLADAVLGLGEPFVVDRDAHRGEHSIEVQLPFLRDMAPDASVVPLAVSAGVGERAVRAGERLGTLLAERAAKGDRAVLAVSSDMAHYPAHAACVAVTERLLPAIVALDPVALAERERDVVRSRTPGLVCGMCGIEPTVLGLAALAAAGASDATPLAAATSADAGGPQDRTVGYLAVAFTDR